MINKKNNNGIPGLLNFYFAFIWGIMVLFISACTDKETQALFPDVDKSAGISILIPDDPGFKTSRAFDMAQEAHMSNLYVVALKKNDTGGTDQMEIIPLNPTTTSFVTGETDNAGQKVYRQFRVNLYPGDYRFYLFANIDLYLDRANGKLSNLISEEDIKNIVLNFDSDTPLEPAHLPMACLPEEIKTSADGSGIGSGRYITITDSRSVIYAEMKYLCAKVRYTILFDATQPSAENGYTSGVSAAFRNNSLRFNVDENLTPVASYLRKKTYLYKDRDKTDAERNEDLDPFLRQPEYESFREVNGEKEVSFTTDIGTWPVDLTRFNWPTNGIDYPSSASQQLSMWENTLDEWKAMRQRAWQGIAYLPENNDAGVTHTVMAFPFVVDKYPFQGSTYTDGHFYKSDYKMIYLFGDNTDESHFNEGNNNGYDHGISRNMMYDVVAIVTDYDGKEDISLRIKVLPWAYESHENNTW